MATFLRNAIGKDGTSGPSERQRDDPKRIPQNGATVLVRWKLSLLMVCVAGMPAIVRAQTIEDARLISARYVAAMNRKGYSFLTNDELDRRRAVVAADAATWLKKPLGEPERAAVLEGVDRCIDRLYTSSAGKVNYGNGFGSGGEEWMYLNDRDYFLTFRYHLWAALSRGEPTPEEAKRRAAQHAWMRDYLKSLPDRGIQEPVPREGMQPSDVRAWALAELEKDFADPLDPLFDPLPEDGFAKLQARFKQFSNGLASDMHDMEVAGLTSRFVDREDPSGRYGRVYAGKLPFQDTVIDLWGDGPSLYFESNAEYRGNHGTIGEHMAFDVVRCAEMRPAEARLSGEALEAWLAKQGRGELTLVGADLTAVRGAKLAVLPVKNWFEADQWTVEELRGAIHDAGTTQLSIKGLPPMNGVHRIDRSEGELFAVVENKEGRVAVACVHNFEFNTAMLWCRIRPVEKK
ncbi:MAG TPA: hypothetical protein VHQ47_19410 [Phycisphaerae bacterium]|nr:hypothetical protein [Phycisphaerae bacterium]